MEWEVKYYNDEYSFKSDCPIYTEYISGDRFYVVDYALRQLQNCGYKYFEFSRR